MKQNKRISWTVTITTAILLFFLSAIAATAAPTSIVVVTHYVEEGLQSKDSADKEHFRRLIRVLNNRLVKSGFEVINAAATEAIAHDQESAFEISKKDSRMNGESICSKYGTDLAYLLWLKVKVRRTSDNYYKVIAFLEGECYDAAGRDIGASISKTLKVTKRDRDEAIWKVEEEVAYKLSRVLTAWKKRSSSRDKTVVGLDSGASSYLGKKAQAKNALQTRADSLKNSYRVILRGATEYEIAEVFGKVVNTVSGVVEAERKSSNLIPDNPQQCYTIWDVQVERTDAFRLQANINKMIKDVIAADGEVVIKGVPYRYAGHEVELLNGLRPGKTTSRSLEFIIDTEFARDSDYTNGFE